MAILGDGWLLKGIVDSFLGMNGHFWEWIAICGNECHLWPLMERVGISENGRPFLVMDGYFWQWVTTSSNGWLFLGIDGHVWEWRAISGNRWPFLGIDGHF